MKCFNTVYGATNISNVDLRRLVLSAAVMCNKNDERYAIGYKIEVCQVILLHFESSINCHSN